MVHSQVNQRRAAGDKSPESCVRNFTAITEIHYFKQRWILDHCIKNSIRDSMTVPRRKTFDWCKCFGTLTKCSFGPEGSQIRLWLARKEFLLGSFSSFLQDFLIRSSYWNFIWTADGNNFLLCYLSSSEREGLKNPVQAWDPFLESPENFSGPKS